MTQKEIERIARELQEKKEAHLLLIKGEEGISLSSIATGEDMFDFLNVLIDESPVILSILEDIIMIRKKRKYRDLKVN